MIMVLLHFNCKESKNIMFCEGVSPDGKGINCGIKFETGDLSAVIRSSGPFETGKINIDIFEVGKKEIVKTESLVLEVKAESTSAMANLSFYRGGQFNVKASKDGKVFAEGDIEIVDY